MKSTFNHYKFQALLFVARLGLTFPLHYSILQNLGMITILFALFAAMGNNYEVSAIVGIAGVLMSGSMLFDLIDKSTYKN